MPATTDDLPPLSPVMHHILLALLEGERHGYAIMQSVERIPTARRGWARHLAWRDQASA